MTRTVAILAVLRLVAIVWWRVAEQCFVFGREFASWQQELRGVLLRWASVKACSKSS
jgi:hypothetical protein